MDKRFVLTVALSNIIFSFHTQAFSFSHKGTNLKLLFNMCKLLALLFLQFVQSLSKIYELLIFGLQWTGTGDNHPIYKRINKDISGAIKKFSAQEKI